MLTVVKRPRNSGKTTILLHYMVVNSGAIYVARTDEYAERAFQKSEELGLKNDRKRFVGMTRVNKIGHNELLIDDADVIIDRYPEMGYNLIVMAKVVTVTEGKR